MPPESSAIITLSIFNGVLCDQGYRGALDLIAARQAPLRGVRATDLKLSPFPCSGSIVKTDLKGGDPRLQMFLPTDSG